MLLKLQVLILLNDFNPCMFNWLSNKHLQNRLNFIFIIEQVSITVEDLRCLGFSFRVWNQDCIWRTIDVIIRFDVVLVHHVLMVWELFPLVCTLHLLLLHIGLIAFLHLLLPIVLLLSSSPHLFLPLAHICLFHLLLFYEGWVWLHVHWDDEGCECVSSHDTSIVHQILRGHLTITFIKLAVRFRNSNLKPNWKMSKLITYTYSL